MNCRMREINSHLVHVILTIISSIQPEIGLSSLTILPKELYMCKLQKNYPSYSSFINYSFVLQAKVYSQKRKLDIVNRVSTRQQWKPNQCRLLILRLCATAPAIPWWQWHCRRLVHRPTTRNILSSNLSLQFCSPE